MSILLRVRHREEAEAQAKVMAQLARETDIAVPLRSGADERNKRLRGIPAVGRNVAGELAGTRPDTAAVR